MYPLTQNVRHISLVLKRHQGKNFPNGKLLLFNSILYVLVLKETETQIITKI